MEKTNRTARTLLTVAEVSDELRVTRGTTYKWIREGTLPAVRVAGTVRVPRSSSSTDSPGVAPDRLARGLARIGAQEQDEPVRADENAGAEKRKKLLARRAAFKLHLPYGKLAAKLGIGKKDPPSEQPAPEPEPPPGEEPEASGPAPFEPKF